MSGSQIELEIPSRGDARGSQSPAAFSRTVPIRRGKDGSMGMNISMKPIASEIIHSFGPVKLGASTVNDLPVVDAVAATSPLVNSIQPGDHIVAVDGANVAGLTLEDLFALFLKTPENAPLVIARVKGPAAVSGLVASAPVRDDASAGRDPAAPTRSLSALALTEDARKMYSRRGEAITNAFSPKGSGRGPAPAPLTSVVIAPGIPTPVILRRSAAGAFGIDFREQPAETGVVVNSIAPASPAGLEGTLRPGDVFVAFDGAPLAGLPLEKVVDLVRKKQEVEVTVVRPPQPRKSSPLRPTPDQAPPVRITPGVPTRVEIWRDERNNVFGVNFDPLAEGVVVLSLVPGTPAADVLQPGDVFKSIDNESLDGRTVADAIELVHEKAVIKVVIVRPPEGGAIEGGPDLGARDSPRPPASDGGRPSPVRAPAPPPAGRSAAEGAGLEAETPMLPAPVLALETPATRTAPKSHATRPAASPHPQASPTQSLRLAATTSQATNTQRPAATPVATPAQSAHSAPELPHVECDPAEANLSSTWGQRIASLRSLPPQLYLREAAARSQRDADLFWGVARDSPLLPRDALDLLDAGLVHFASGGLPCRRSVFARIMQATTPGALRSDFLVPIFEDLAARTLYRNPNPLAIPPPPGIVLTGPSGYLSELRSAALPTPMRSLLELVRDWVLRSRPAPAVASAAPPPEVHSLSWPQFEAFFTAWHEAFGASELAWLLSSLSPPEEVHGDAAPPAEAPNAASGLAGLVLSQLAYTACDVDAWLEACAALAGDVWLVDGVEVAVPSTVPGADVDGLAPLASTLARGVDARLGRSPEWYRLWLGVRHEIVAALVDARPASPHVVFVLNRGLARTGKHVASDEQPASALAGAAAAVAVSHPSVVLAPLTSSPSPSSSSRHAASSHAKPAAASARPVSVGQLRGGALSVERLPGTGVAVGQLH